MSSSFPSGVPWTVHSVRLLPDSLSVRWDDGPNACNPDGGSPDEFPFVYLRDHCRCERCFHPVSLGRLSRLGELDFEVRAEAAEVTDGGGKVKVRWSDGHESRYDGEWLWRRAFCPGRSPERARPTGRSGLIAFLGDSDPVPTHSYQDVMESEEKLLDWLEGAGASNNRNGFVAIVVILDGDDGSDNHDNVGKDDEDNDDDDDVDADKDNDGVNVGGRLQILTRRA